MLQTEDMPRGEPFIVQDMPQMAQFVYDMYRNKIQHMMAAQHLVSICMHEFNNELKFS